MPSLPSSLALTSIATNAQILSADHRNNYSAIQTAVNALITALSGGTSGQELQATGASSVAYVTPPSTVTYRKTTSKTVVSSVTETDLLNGEITVAANAMSTDRVLRLTAWGDWLHNAAGGFPRFKLKFGGTTLLDTGEPGGGPTTSASRNGWRITAEIAESGATNVQWATIDGRLSHQGAAGGGSVSFTTGEGSYTNTNTNAWIAAFVGGNSGALDTTTSKLLELTVINGANSASYETKLFGALVVIE